MNTPPDSAPGKKGGKSPGLAAVLGLLLPGAGSIYCRQDNKGVFVIGMALLGQWSTGGLSSLILCPAMALDAFMIARKFNRGDAVRRWEFFPGIKPLNSIPTRIILFAIVALVAILTVVHIIHFAAGYNSPAK